MPTRTILLLSACAAVLSGQTPIQADPRFAKGDAAISAEEAHSIVKTLADKPFAGRLSGHEGYTAAAKWTAAKFQEWGLQALPGTKNGLQPYPCPYSVIDKASLKVEISGKPVPVDFPKDYLPMLYADAGKARGGAVFAGWGIQAPELKYDDFAGLDVKGKWVICFRGTPDRDEKWSHHDEHRTRMALAKSKSALGILYIVPEVAANPNGDYIPGLFSGNISEGLAEKLLVSKAETVNALKKKLKDTKKPHSFVLEATFETEILSRHFPKGEGYNVAFFVPGSDPALAQECVVVGGHLDHCGEHMGILYPGADDNASGSAVVMAAGRALKASGLKPKRSVVFALFGSEEQGGEGARTFVKALPLPFKKVTAMLNFDMEGVGNKAFVSLSAPLEADKALLNQADAGLAVVGEVGSTKKIGVRSGDITPFFQVGAGIASVFSAGKRPAFSYHLPADNISLIDGKILAGIAKLGYRYAYLLADR